jgi:hypothetical protein
MICLPLKQSAKTRPTGRPVTLSLFLPRQVFFDALQKYMVTLTLPHSGYNIEQVIQPVQSQFPNLQKTNSTTCLRNE